MPGFIKISDARKAVQAEKGAAAAKAREQMDQARGYTTPSGSGQTARGRVAEHPSGGSTGTLAGVSDAELEARRRERQASMFEAARRK